MIANRIATEARERTALRVRAAQKRGATVDHHATMLALARVLWLHVADRASCGCETRPRDGAAWTAPLCGAVRVLGLGRHFDCDRTAKRLMAMGYVS